MLTPQEVQEKVFPKASGLGGGYQMAAVDQFLDSLTEDYTSIFKENVTLKAKLKVLADKIEEYRATEDSMRATLLTAQKMAAKLVQEAQAEHDSLIATARRDAAEEMTRLDLQIKAEEEKLQLAQKNSSEYITKSVEMLKEQATFLENLRDLKKVPELPKEETETAGKKTEEVLSTMPEEKFAAEYAEATAADLSADIYKELEADISLSLEELKFGRNYGKDKKD